MLWKYKAHLCIDGSQQLKGEDYTESYATVIQWSTVCLVMILASMMNLESRQIDFDQAFTQADLKDDIYMHLPQGWQVDATNNWCIKLNKNLYGLVQASRSWYKTHSYNLGSNNQCMTHACSSEMIASLSSIWMIVVFSPTTQPSLMT